MIGRRRSSRLLKVSATCFCLTVVICLIQWIWFPSLPKLAELNFFGFILEADTQYAPDFHPLSWDRIEVGDSEENLYTRFGQPLVKGDQSWIYDWTYDDLGLMITLDGRAPGGGRVISNAYDDTKNRDSDEKYQGMSNVELRNALGDPSSVEKRPDTVVLWYSTPRGGFGQSSYIQFIVGVDPTMKKVVWKHLDYYGD